MSTVSGDSAPGRPPIDPGPLPSAQKKFAPHCQQKISVRPFQISPNSEKRCRKRQNRDFGSSEAYFERKTVPQESESASIRSARRFPTFPCVWWSRDHFSKTNNSKKTKNVFLVKPSLDDNLGNPGFCARDWCEALSKSREMIDLEHADWCKMILV